MSSFFFQNILGDADKLQQDFLGPDYSYYKKIKNPGELGVSAKGSLGALATDIESIVDYVKVIVSGSGAASKVGGPLGNRYFLKTPGTCKDYKTGKEVTRSMYIDNVPTSNIPIVSNMSGIDFPEFRGLAPGLLEDTYDINPLKMFRAFMEGSEPVCAEVTLETVDANNVKGKESGYIPISELIDMASDGQIPEDVVTTEMRDALKSKEGFCDMRDKVLGYVVDDTKYVVKKPTISANIYYAIVSVLLFYVLYRIVKR